MLLLACAEPETTTETAPKDTEVLTGCDAPVELEALDDLSGTDRDRMLRSGDFLGLDDGVPADPTIVVLPYGTTDYPRNPTLTQEFVEAAFVSDSTSIGGFYAESSFGRFTPRFEVVDPIDLDMDWYTWGEMGYLAQIAELVPRMDVDWSSYDRDGDGVVETGEAVPVLLDSAGGSGAMRPSGTLSFENSSGAHVVDLAVVYASAKMASDPQPDVDTLLYNFGGITHELGHALFNFPDLYGESPNTAVNYEPMNCCVWGDLLIEYTPWERVKLGWVEPALHVAATGDDVCVRLRPSEAYPDLLVWTDPRAPKQWWVFETRLRAASAGNYDRDLYEDGLGVWWVAKNEVDWGPYDFDEVWVLDRDVAGELPNVESPYSPSFFTEPGQVPVDVVSDDGEAIFRIEELRQDGDDWLVRIVAI